MKPCWTYVLLIFVLLPFAETNAQINKDYKSSDLQLLGLRKNNESYIRGLLGRAYKSNGYSTLDSDIQLLRNLPGITDVKRVEHDSIPLGSIALEIEERVTALPVINFGGIRGNIWFTLGVSDNNFRGQEESLLAYYQYNNGKHTGKIFYKKPRIAYSNWGYSANISSWSSTEPIFFVEGTEQYDYNNNGLGATVIRNIGINDYVELGATYFVETFDRAESNLGAPLGPDGFSLKKFLFRLEYKISNLNYQEIYLTGLESKFSYQNVYTFENKDIFNSFQYNGRLFLRPKKKINIALRLRAAISSNDDTPFAPFVLDSNINIRGVGNRIDRGTAQVILNAELRYTSYRKKYWFIQNVIFSDSGTWRNPGGTFRQLVDSNQFRHFMGAGIRVSYQKVFGATLRIDYGIDIYNPNERGFVIGLGQYF